MIEATNFSIELGGLNDPRVIALLKAHLDLMRSQSPPESTHALDIDGLSKPSMMFWTAKLAGKPVGCIAMKLLTNSHAEIKSMHTAAAARGHGIARALLENLEATAINREISQLSLETGTPDGFEPARMFYKNSGYHVCGPFGDYKEDPYSVFMTKVLT